MLDSSTLNRPDVDDVEAELALRELARRRLSWYWAKAFPQLTPGAWQHDLCGVLEEFLAAVERGEGPCLIIEAPPQYGKSVTVSRAFPAWVLGKHPDWPIILASYAASLAEGHGRWIRNILSTPWHAQVFPDPNARLANDSKAMDQFSTVLGGQFLSRGVGGGTTGQPAKIFVVDDPFADRKQADSVVTRETVWDWFSSVVSTRLAPGGGKLVMNTRWHLDDLVGRIVAQAESRPDGDRWQVVTYKALAEESDRLHRKVGECLFPERYSLAEVLKKKATMIPRDWMALMQQEPVSDAGGYFKRTWFRDYTETPKVGEVAVAIDFAYKDEEENDYTCCLPFGMTETSDLTVLPSWFCERLETDASVDRLLDVIEETGADTLVTGRDALQSIGPFLLKEMDKRNLSVVIHEMPEFRDLIARARTFQGYMQRGKVQFPHGDLLDTVVKPMMLAFPAHKHDDPVSAGAMMCWLLNDCAEYRPAAKPKRVNPDEKRWKEHSARKKRFQDGKIEPLFGPET